MPNGLICSFIVMFIFTDVFKNSDLMWKQSVWTSTISGYLASHHLKPEGLLTLTGAKASLTATPGNITSR